LFLLCSGVYLPGVVNCVKRCTTQGAKFLATLAVTLTFILRVTSCSLACIYRRWCLQLQGKKKVTLYYEAVSVSSSETSEIVYQTSRCQIFRHSCASFRQLNERHDRLLFDTKSACRDSNLKYLERQTSITDLNRSDILDRPDVGNSLSLCMLIFFLTLGRIPCKGVPIM